MAFALLLSLGLGGCGTEARATGASRVAIAVQLDRAGPSFGVVTVTGLDPGMLRRLGSNQQALKVFASSGDQLEPGTPPLIGKWRVVAGSVEFVPAFAPSGGMHLTVRVDTAALAGRSAAAALEARFEIPMQAISGAPAQLSAIHPSADTLPENLLRWYLEFTSPMTPGEVLEHVHLIDDTGATVNDAFLMVGEELWDPSRTRLTLLLDPGRVKQGIRTNVELGRPLKAGRNYTLRVDAEWRDAMDRPLGRETEKRFVVIEADYAEPDPGAWRVSAPASNARDPLIVRFGEPLDHALAYRLLVVHDSKGNAVPGEVELARGDHEWRFTPSTTWNAGLHQVRVSPELEDVAGNRPGRVFDRDVTVAASPPAVMIRSFVVR